MVFSSLIRVLLEPMSNSGSSEAHIPSASPFIHTILSSQCLPPHALQGEESLELVSKEEPVQSPSSSSPSNTWQDSSGIGSLLSSWAQAAQHHPDGLGVGCVVFAKRRTVRVARGSHSPLRYALAEVTGIQRAEATLTVAFLFSPPGVEDEEVSVFDVIPCDLVTWRCLRGSRQDPRSLLERFLSVAPEGGPVPEDFLFRSVVGSIAQRSGGDVVAVLRQLYAGGETINDASNLEAPSVTGERPPEKQARDPSMSVEPSLAARASWCFQPIPGASSHQSYADAFKVLDKAISNDWCQIDTHHTTLSSAPIILCVFDSFSLLKRFQLFMSVRGHVVRLLPNVDVKVEAKEEVPEQRHTGEPAGVRKRPRSVAVGNAGQPIGRGPRPRPVSPYAFQTQCKVWLCIQRKCLDSKSEKEIETMCRSLPPIEFLLHFVVSTSIEETPLRLLESLLEDSLRHSLVANFTHLADSIKPIDIQGGSGAKPPPVVKVSGEIFSGRKVLVPPSPEQLLLLSTVLSSSSHNDPKEGLFSPALLECISLGHFSDLSAFQLFSSYSNLVGVIQDDGKHSKKSAPSIPFSSIDKLHHAVFIDPLSFGECFPVFSVLRSIISDALVHHVIVSPGETASGPRIAVVLPRGNASEVLPSHQFLRNLEAYLSPWSVYELTPSVVDQKSILATTHWHSRGGVLLVYCDDADSQLSLIHMEADTVIACGKRSAAWVAACAGNQPLGSPPRYYAVISEIEVVSQCETYVWTPYRPPASCSIKALSNPISGRDESSFATAERESLWQTLQSYYQNINDKSLVPRALHQSMTLWFFLDRNPAENSPNLATCAKSIALSSATTSPITLKDLTLVEEALV